MELNTDETKDTESEIVPRVLFQQDSIDVRDENHFSVDVNNVQSNCSKLEQSSDSHSEYNVKDMMIETVTQKDSVLHNFDSFDKESCSVLWFVV